MTAGGESKTAHGSGSGNSNGNGDSNGNGTQEYSDVVSGNMDVITILRSYSHLNILRNVEATAAASDLPPAGLAGVLHMTLIITATAVPSTDVSEKTTPAANSPPNITPPSTATATGAANISTSAGAANDNAKQSARTSFRSQKEFIQAHPDIERNAGRKYCIVLDGVFSYMPESIVSQGGHTRPIGSTENKSVSLAGFVVRKVSPTRISLAGSRGERLSFLLDASTTAECDHWVQVFSAHVEFIDFQAGSRWIF
jgi:hypothetical protein